jgi:cobalt-zinc-cadmium efflux system outer membrane protein
MIFKNRMVELLKRQICLCGASIFLGAIVFAGIAAAQSDPSQPGVRITLDQAEQMALAHNRALRADLMLISESKASEITAGLRPNPVFDTDAQFIPFFSPSNLNSDYMDNSAQFDAGLSYKFELYGKRKARIRSARAATVVTSSLVDNDERQLRYDVAAQFINVLYAESKLRFAQQDLATFDKSLAISQKQYQAGSISHGNLLKLQLQRLLFQTDLTSAQVAVIQAKNNLRQLVGFDSVPQNFDVIGRLEAPQPKLGLMDLEADALKMRPDLQAARQLIVQAQSEYHLARTYAHPDLGTTVDYTHLAGNNDLSAFATIGIPIFNRNQGNIAKTSAQITQAQEQERAAEQLVLTQVRSAYARQQSALQVVGLYDSGYLKEAQQSLSISQYAYLRGDTSLLNFLDAERSYRTVELNYRRALARAMLSEQRVEEAIGMSASSGKVH